MIPNEKYATSTNSSFLQALGPYRTYTASDLVTGVFYEDMENVTNTVKTGEISYHGERKIEKVKIKEDSLEE